MRSLIVMAVLGAVVTIYGIYANARDVRLATGATGDAQLQFFVEASERPDIELFYQNLEPEQRHQMARDIGEYDHPALAKLIGKMLTTFDTDARAILTASLTKLAKTQPKAVASQLALAGSFQRLAVATALRSAGTDVEGIVAERLKDAASRPNAVAFLVESGSKSIPPLMPLLKNETADVRLAAADALGKLRAREATAELLQLYSSSAGSEKSGYLAALAGIGDARAETVLADALANEALPSPERAQAALGLGRIGSPSATEMLWSMTDAEEPQIRDSAISGLQTAGEATLADGSGDIESRVRVAAGIQGEVADRVLTNALEDPIRQRLAADASHDRESMVPALAQRLRGVSLASEGDFADALIRSLASTPAGLDALRQIQNPGLQGLITRRLDLLRSSG